MVKLGTAFQLKGDGNHLWVVISERNSEGKVVTVNLTDARHYPESTCHLAIGDHVFINKPCVIRYKSPRLWRASDIERYLTSGTFIQHPDISAALMDRIIEGAFASEDLPPIFLAYIKPAHR